MLLLLAISCLYITDKEQDARFDLDEDGVRRPMDCDDDDPDVGVRTWYFDGDGDTFGAGSGVVECTAPSAAYVLVDGDCDDARAEAYPDADELCNELDDDCDGEIDDDAIPLTWFEDRDGDGFGRDDEAIESCEPPSGYVLFSGDCDDDAPAIHPDADEICNGLDDDCDGLADDADDDVSEPLSWYRDDDSDGFGVDEDVLFACEAPSGYADSPQDCDDSDPAINPGASEDDCTDPVDYNCDGSVGFSDDDGDGFAACEECDDGDAAVNPDALEICNEGVDDDCDGSADGADADGAVAFYADADTDGYGDPSTGALSCEAPSGYVSDNTDCDDTDISINPAGTEVCDDADADEDCDSLSDDDDDSVTGQSTVYADVDGDGYGDPDAAADYCDPPSGYVADDSDCNDANSARNPDTVWYADDDGDGYGDSGDSTVQCEKPSGYVSNTKDCDDADGDINVDADEVCLDRVDNDCDGTVDTCDAQGVDSAMAWIQSGEDNVKLGGGLAYGDMDGDGQADIVVTDNNETSDGTGSGAVYIFFGPVSGDVSVTDADVTLLGERRYRVGHTVDVLDFTGDGVGDLLIGAYGYPSNGAFDDGAAWVVEGPFTSGSDLLDTQALTRFEPGDSNAFCGSAVNNAGDVDGDGADDVLIGALYEDGPGAVWLVMAASVSSGTMDLDSEADVLFEGGANNDNFGFAASGAGDVDGDGAADVVVGAYGVDDGSDNAIGEVYLYLAPTSGTLATTDADTSSLGEADGDRAGFMVTDAGDVDGDGYDDVLTASAKEATAGTDAGAAYLLSGAATPSWDLASATAKMTAETSGAQLGNSRGWQPLGDFDGDGNADLLIGSAKDSTGFSSNGAVYILLGPVSGTLDLANADLIFRGPDDNDQLGQAISPAGDQDGDGIIDIILGADKGENPDGDNNGGAWLFSGGDYL